MTDFRPADHAMGLELQLEELFEQQRRAMVQGRGPDAEQLQSEIEQLQSELAATSELVVREPRPPDSPQMHDAEKLSVPDD